MCKRARDIFAFFLYFFCILSDFAHFFDTPSIENPQSLRTKVRTKGENEKNHELFAYMV